VALVTGASRGVGRGIALALGEAGATVVVTGRSTRGRPTTERLPGTVDDTADAVTNRGGTGVALRCDHADDDDVARVFDVIGHAYGRLDILVNNVWSGYDRWGDARFDAKFWDQPLWRWDLCLGSVRAHYAAAQLAAPFLLESGRGLIIEVGYTDGDTYLGQVAYDVAKAACDRMAAAMAEDFARSDVVALSLHPGFVRTERVEHAAGAMSSGPASIVHSSEYVGRAVAHLSADRDVARFAGAKLAVGDLARTYGFCDTDGGQPPAFRLEGRRSLANRMEMLYRAAHRSSAGPTVVSDDGDAPHRRADKER
jgi:NAD(P)-dependent dehydrogenase (short-subunit alcohol dehydrogenase family)